MPNWCQNRFYVEGDKSDLEKFYSDNSEGKFNLLYSYAVPEMENTVENPDYDWYTWRLNNWGVKWELDSEVFYDIVSDNVIEYTFDSPWGPPIPYVEALSEKYPHLKFKLEYCEMGMQFAGTFEIVANVIVRNDEYSSEQAEGFGDYA